METGKENQKELQMEDSWIPKTPFKPILPKAQVISTNTQGNQLDQTNGLGSKGFSSGCSQESRDRMLRAYLDSAANGNWKAALEAQKGITSDSVETCGGFPTNGTARCNFTSLLALQDQASVTTTSPFGSNRSRINGNYSQESQYNVPSYNLGEPAESKTTSQIIPLTPEKDAIVGCRQVTPMKYVYTEQRENQERNEQENGTATTAVGFQIDKEHQELPKGSLSAVVYTLIKENHNHDKETPQQKPRRRKHRPKVVTEGRPRTRKPVTAKPTPSTESLTLKRKYVRKKPLNNAPKPLPAVCKENTTGKRTYVRKKPLNKASTTPPVGGSKESSNPKALESANKSCRRSLNFDIEAKPGDDSSNCKPNCNKYSQPQTQDVSAGNQPKSTVAIGQGIEVIVKTTQAGIAYDLADSVNQMLKDYTSLPEKQAPSTLLPAKSYPPNGKQNDNSQESHAKAKAQGTAHTVHQNTTQIMLPADTQLPSANPDGSNCRTCTILIDEGKANGSKRKLFNSIQQPDSYCTNLSGIQYNSLPTYQIIFSDILKKKRTEKGQNSTISSTSCVTVAKDIGRTDITCSQKDVRVYPSTSTSNCLMSTPHCTANGILGAYGETGGLQSELQNSDPITSQTERSTKKRARRPTRVQDLVSLTKTARGAMHQTYTARLVPADYNVQQVGDSNRPHACIKALVAELSGTLTTKKRTKKRVFPFNSSSSTTNGEQSNEKIILFKQSQFLAKSLDGPPEVIWSISPVDAIVEQLQLLDINRESGGIAYKEQSTLVPYNIGNEQQNALVLYRRDDTIIPFADSFVPIKKRRPRPKVYLDDETNRVWKLLLGNINSEGIDGTDEEKAKWWKEEREVFRGRANSFIARMHLVQGDRRFSQWKGSVVDSVIGVFLTQNVSDHLSSSAFMSLAAHFPLKSTSNNNPCYEERTSSVIEKPIACMPDLEAIKWNEMSNQSICDQSSMTLHDPELDEEREVVNSNESSTSSTSIIGSRSDTYYGSMVNRSTTETTKTADIGYIGEKTSATNDAFSSQNSVISSQNSADSPTAQTAERKESFSGNSEAEDLIDVSKFNSWNSSSSFMELLIKAGSNKLFEVQSHGNDSVLSDQNSKDECNETQNAGNDFRMHKTYNVDSPKSSLEASAFATPSNNCQSRLISNLEGLGFECYKMITEETRCYEISKNSRNSMKEQSSFTSKSASQTTDENNMTVAAQEASASPTPNNPSCSKIQEGKHTTTQTQRKLVEDLHIFGKSQNQMQNKEMQNKLYDPNPGKSLDIVESSSAFNPQQKNSQKTTESDLIEQGFSEIKDFNEMNAATRKAKSRRVGKEIREHVDWDALRKQTEANGRKRQRTPNTMDSLDWEAVRCADVNEIANTIKERGMNNMLAERIKNFLNRLVREHGSIDLEWLRDVPPDNAKEYLLSIRGLGLKSVECVRLLTLHHLAFPVDTNVGRIAVRLGWVPLQPLPESLQLHLLELYPVLESIQKYLWPRLCKLDQRTLYELHYQMITFGKVFCTKSKPNCNACPMRGECRHFASAFASARLALPGPEEKGIVSATENRTNEQNPAVMVNHMPLLLPQASEPSEGNQQSEPNQHIEAKYAVSNCEPIVEEPSSPEPECPKVTENDMEDTFCEDPEEIPTIKLNIEEFTQNLQNYMQENMELQEGDMSKALVALTAEAASIPAPKLKNVSRLRTEHQVFELPDSHPLLQGLDKREPDDPCSYLLAIWTPGETANSIQPPESWCKCNSQEYGKLCDEKTCFSCNCIREANSQIVRGTLLIPCRTAMRGSFPLNGTYFQVNEVFADHDSSLNPIDVPRTWIWNLPRRTVYFGTSIPTIFKGLTTEGIQHCFWRGYVCVRGFDQKTRAPRPLIARLHFPASKLNKAKGKNSNDS